MLFLDEVDALRGDVLVSVLRQLRSGYAERPRAFPAAVALIGLRDVREYRLEVRDERETLGTSSPFNVKVESLRIRSFTRDEVAELYRQHEEETGQTIDAKAADLAFELSDGHPWLVNALAKQAVEVLRPDVRQPITRDVVEAAKEALIARRDTHLDSLVDRLRDPRVRRVVAPILAGELLAPELLDDDVELAKDLGLVRVGQRGLEIANPIYREVVPRALTAILETSARPRRRDAGRLRQPLRCGAAPRRALPLRGARPRGESAAPAATLTALEPSPRAGDLELRLDAVVAFLSDGRPFSSRAAG